MGHARVVEANQQLGARKLRLRTGLFGCSISPGSYVLKKACKPQTTYSHN
jgi:hypothetical protein